MSQQLSQPVVVENRTDAGVVTGADVVAKAGHTMLYGAVSLALTSAMFRSLPFDPVRDFAPIALLARILTVLVVSPDVVPAVGVGLPGWEAYTWQMIWAPAGTPAPILQRMNAEANRAVRVPAIRQRIEDGGGTVIDDSTPESATLYMRREFERWVPMLRAAGVQPA